MASGGGEFWPDARGCPAALGIAFQVGRSTDDDDDDGAAPTSEQAAEVTVTVTTEGTTTTPTATAPTPTTASAQALVLQACAVIDEPGKIAATEGRGVEPDEAAAAVAEAEVLAAQAALADPSWRDFQGALHDWHRNLTSPTTADRDAVMETLRTVTIECERAGYVYVGD